MVSSEVQRTLVKSPPELWAELSDPDSLARHLDALGEIRIIATKPESTVEWEGENVAGTVTIKASGWGTKVTLTVTRSLPDQEQTIASEAASEPAVEAASEPAGEAAPGPAVEAFAERRVEGAPEPAADEAPAAPEPATAQAPADPQASAVAAEPAVASPERRRGLFARLFGRRRRARPQTEAPTKAQDTEAQDAEAQDAETRPELPAPDTFAAISEALVPSNIVLADPFAGLAPAPCRAQAPVDVSAELRAAEEVAAEEVRAVLTAVLDRLGAAHHRPFSRA